jgi:hypothetical protein
MLPASRRQYDCCRTAIGRQRTGATSCRWETSHGFKLSSGDCAAVCPGLCARRMRCGGVGSRARCPRGGCPGRGGLGGGCRRRRALVVEGSGAGHR